MESLLKEFQHLKIHLEEIKSATNNFDDKKVIGIGGFGKVYEGELSHYKGPSKVAFKRLDSRFGQGTPEFWKEIMMLSRYTHENLIALLGFCDEGGEKILIYEHASNGSLDRVIGSTTLTWSQRLKICLDAARGLRYLHEDKGAHQRILHRDIKSSNILLDEYWNAKISDMGLSKIGPANQPHTALITNVVGTIGYLDPMYMELGILTKESDVYSFGVVLFEILCGRLCFGNRNGRFLSVVRMWKQKYKEKKLDDIIFQDLIHELDPKSLEIFSDIAFQCLQKYREERPLMSLVVEKIETALKLQMIYEELKNPVDYERVIETAVYPQTYKSEEELRMCLSKGILLDGGKTWFSLNKNGEHCERISASECIIEDELQPSLGGYVSEENSRFPSGNCYITTHLIFKARVRTQFLSPKITYTVNLVIKCSSSKAKQEMWTTQKERFIGICYRLKGETNQYVSCLADVRDDGWWMVELFQFQIESRNIDLEILFEGAKDYYNYRYMIEGIEFRPIEKMENEVVEVDKVDMRTISESDDTYWEKILPNDYDDIIKWSKDGVKWTTKKELYSILCKGFLMSNDQAWFFLSNSGKRCLMLSASAALIERQWVWKYEPQSRFGRVASYALVDPFSVFYNIELSQVWLPKTRYACYLVYKLSETTSNLEFPLKVKDGNFDDEIYWDRSNNFRFIYLLNPQTPVIRPKVDQNSYNPLNRPKLKGIPRQRGDGWMEIRLCEFQPGTFIQPKSTSVGLATIFSNSLIGLTVQGLEFRPD